MKKVLLLFVSSALLLTSQSYATHEAGEAHGRVFFVSPKDGDKVKSPVLVKFGVEGMKLQAAGQIKAGFGHHHLIIDGTPVAKGEIVAKDEKHLHFGKAEMETTISLTPGEHTLTLQLADGAHGSYGPEWSSTIKITVQK